MLSRAQLKNKQGMLQHHNRAVLMQTTRRQHGAIVTCILPAVQGHDQVNPAALQASISTHITSAYLYHFG